MRAFGKLALLAVVAVWLLVVSASPAPNYTITKKFGKKELVRIQTVSGDCVVRRGIGDEIEVMVVNGYSPRGSFQPEFRVRGNTLRVYERIYSSNHGSATWTLIVPQGTEIEFSSASGCLTVYGLEGDFRANTASGDVQIEKCRGKFKLSTASGNVDATGVVINGESVISSASGTVNIELSKGIEHDLHVGSASGRVIVDYCGNPIRGYFEFTAKVRQGHIVSPFQFEVEEKFHKHGDLYVRKVFKKGSEGPNVTIGTASGRVVLRE